MRVFYTNTAGATFFQGTSYTFVFRKDYIEIVWNFGKRSYGITNLIFSDKNEVTLCCNWGSFFNRVLHHEDPNKLFAMLKKPCPLVVDLFVGGIKDVSFVTVPFDGGIGCISKRVKVDLSLPIEQILSAEGVVDAANDVLDVSLKICHEINKNCPFPGWKKGLKEMLG